MRPRKWTETAIRQAFDGFVEKYNRLPTKQEMYEKYNGRFPRPLSAKLTLGMTLSKYLKLNYTTYLNRCQSSVYGRMPKEYWVEDFKKQYIKYGSPSEDRYNQIRSPQTPNTQTIAKIIGVGTWCDVLKYCGLLKTKKELDGELVFEETLENYQILNEKLQNLIETLK